LASGPSQCNEEGVIKKLKTENPDYGGHTNVVIHSTCIVYFDVFYLLTVNFTKSSGTSLELS
jgi:hypothetical protein